MRILSLFLLMGFLLSQSPLVELSKKEKERRKKIKTAKVITNADLGKAPRPSVIIKGGKSSLPAVMGEESEGEKSTKKTKEWWVSRKRKLEEKIASLKKKIQELQQKVNALSTNFLIEQRPIAQQRVKSALEKAKGQLEAAKKELAEAEKALEKLYEDARKAGIPPGWLR